MSEQVQQELDATPEGIYGTMVEEGRKRGEVMALLSQYVVDFATSRDHETVADMFKEDSEGVNTCRLELYEPFKVPGYDEKGTEARRLYERIAQRWSRYRKGVLAMIEAMEGEETPEVETCEGETPTNEPPTEVASEGAEISSDEDKLYRDLQIGLRALCVSYLNATGLTNELGTVIDTAVMELRAFKAEQEA